MASVNSGNKKYTTFEIPVKRILYVVLICLLFSSCSGLRFNIPLNIATFSEESCHDISENETRNVYRGDAWTSSNIFHVRIPHENRTVYTSLTPSIDYRGFMMSITFRQRFHIFTLDDNVTRCRNLRKEDYGAVCVYTWNFKAAPMKAHVQSCFAIAFKGKTIKFRGYEFGCLSASNLTTAHTPWNNKLGSDTPLHTFLHGASQGYHRILCSRRNSAHPLLISNFIIISALILLYNNYIAS